MGAVGATGLERFQEELAEVLSEPLRAVPTGPQELGELLNSLARDSISPVELADALLEEHGMNKAALSKRAKGLVKVAIQKGLWV